MSFRARLTTFFLIIVVVPMAAMGFPIAFAVAPGDIGPTFARLGVPYKFAYAIDLTFRFVPSLAADMSTTMDAQRVRGYDWDRVRAAVSRLVTASDSST